MKSQREHDPVFGELYIAGEFVAPGIYRQIGTRREVCLDSPDILPGSLDGRVACYELVQYIYGHTDKMDARSTESHAIVNGIASVLQK